MPRVTPLTDLITSQRACFNPQIQAANSVNPAQVAALISVASQQIRNYTYTDIQQCTYSERFNGEVYKGDPKPLRQNPVTRIIRLATLATPALQVINNSPSNQRATIETFQDPASSAISDILLTWVASAVTTTLTLTAANYPTLGQMSAAINNAGSGWSCSVQSAGVPVNMNLYPTADLWPLQGAMTALSGSFAYIEAYLEDLFPFSNFPYDDGGGWAEGWGTSQTAWRLDQETGELYGRFPRGQQNIRIDYVAGHSTIPNDVQEAVAAQVAFLYNAANVNYTRSSEGTQMNHQVVSKMYMPPYVKALLAPYRRPSVAMYRG